jgi:hypothetical protein
MDGISYKKKKKKWMEFESWRHHRPGKEAREGMSTDPAVPQSRMRLPGRPSKHR